MTKSYSYCTATSDDDHYLIDAIFEQNEEFARYVNKLIEIRLDYQKRELYSEYSEAFKDAAFDKIIENATDTIKARIFYDSFNELEWFIDLYANKFRRGIWHNNELFSEFKSHLPVSMEEWIKYIIEVLEDPEVLKIFVRYDQENEVSKYYETDLMKKLQEVVDEEMTDENIEKVSRLIKELKSLS